MLRGDHDHGGLRLGGGRTAGRRGQRGGGVGGAGHARVGAFAAGRAGRAHQLVCSDTRFLLFFTLALYSFAVRLGLGDLGVGCGFPFGWTTAWHVGGAVGAVVSNVNKNIR